MTRIAFRDWIFDCAVDATRTAYQGITAGGVEECNCDGCLNFLCQRQTAFPSEVMNFFRLVGVDYRRDAEFYHVARADSGLHLYEGWFHFIGSIVQQPDGPAKIDDRFTIDFLPGRSLAAKTFGDQPLVQVEVTASIPWMLTGVPEPMS